MEGPEPWDPGAFWTPVPFSKTEFKIFKISESDTEEEAGMFDKVQWSVISGDESEFEEE